MLRHLICALAFAGLAGAGDPAALKELAGAQKARKTAVEEGFRAMQQSCGANSAKAREARLLYRKAMERTNGLLDGLAAGRAPDEALVQEAEAANLQVMAYLELGRCDGTTAAPGERQAPHPILPGLVRAALGDGAFGPTTRVAFDVRPPWWKTWWARLGEVIAALAGLSALVRFRLAALARSKVELEALVALRTRELQGRNEELSAALGNVKQLSGLLPICAACKKIRDDSGYWNQLESYISRHSEADFSHGICPECADEMFPELAEARRQLPPT